MFLWNLYFKGKYREPKNLNILSLFNLEFFEIKRKFFVKQRLLIKLSLEN